MADWHPFRYAGFWDQPRTIYTTNGRQAFMLDCPFDDALDDFPSEYAVFAAPVLALWPKRDYFPEPLLDWVNFPRLGGVVLTRDHLDATFREQIDWDLLAAFRSRT